MSDAWVAGEYRVRYLDREGVEHVEVVEVRPYATTDGWGAWCDGWPAFSGRDAAHALRHAVGAGGRELFVLEIIAPGVPARAELCAQVAKITALLDTTEHRAAAQELDLHSLRGNDSALVAQREAVAAELAPMARAADALRAAAVAAGHPAEGEDPEAQLHAVRAAAWSMGSEVMRTAAVAVCRRVEDYHGPDPMRRGWPAQVGAGDCRVNIQKLPTPPCPRGACAATATETH